MKRKMVTSITKHNYRRLLFAIIFIIVNIIRLPVRIKSGFDLQKDDTHATNTNVGQIIDGGTIKLGSVWTDSYSPRHLKEQNVRISFRLHDPKDEPRPDKFLSVSNFFCNKNRTDLPPSLGPSDKGRLFDFTTTVSTNLNIMFMGDSLGHQFSQGFDAAVLGKGYEHKRHVHMSYLAKGRQFDCLATSAPIRGGGVTAFWRYTKLLERRRKARIAPCYIIERLWGDNFLDMVLDYKYSDLAPEANQMQTVSGFDAVVIRLPHGWMKAEELTKERVKEVVIFCQELLGARAVIFTTVGLDNNAITKDMWDGVMKINEIIRDVAKNWEPPKDGEDGVKWIFVQEFSSLTSQILYENGKHIGYNVSTNDFFFERLEGGETSWAQSIPMVCANKPKDNLNSECKRNKISPDGIHWCVETIGPRFTASIACLLGCVYNEKPHGTTPEDVEKVRTCERGCNEQFMSLKRVDESLIGNEKTLYASS